VYIYIHITRFITPEIDTRYIHVLFVIREDTERPKLRGMTNLIAHMCVSTRSSHRWQVLNLGGPLVHPFGPECTSERSFWLKASVLLVFFTLGALVGDSCRSTGQDMEGIETGKGWCHCEQIGESFPAVQTFHRADTVCKSYEGLKLGQTIHPSWAKGVPRGTPTCCHMAGRTLTCGISMGE
jgi:hypothetical protein